MSDSEYQAAGIGAHAGELYSENAYRGDRMTMYTGVRTLGGSDWDMHYRDTYNVPGAEHHDHDH